MSPCLPPALCTPPCVFLPPCPHPLSVSLHPCLPPRCLWGTCRWTWDWFSTTVTLCCLPSHWLLRSVWQQEQLSSSCQCWLSSSCTGRYLSICLRHLQVHATVSLTPFFCVSVGGRVNRRSEIIKRFYCNWKLWRSMLAINVGKSSQVSVFTYTLMTSDCI